MKVSTIIPIAALAFASTSAGAQIIGSNGETVKGKRAPDTAVRIGQPLPRNEPIAPGQRSAFAGQTRAPATATRTPIEVKVVTRNLAYPWGLAFIGDDRAIITEKPGTMRIVDLASGSIVSGVLGVPRVVYGSDAGLLDIVTDPKFAINQRVYFTYVEPRGEGESGIVVARARLTFEEAQSGPDYTLKDVTKILRVAPGINGKKHFGSRLAFDREGFLYVSLAERFYSPYRDEAQSLYSWLGKILRVDTDGKPAPGNPYATNQNAENSTRPEIWSYGQRNPQGLAFHPETGDLWDGEHGPQGGDEINLIRRGANYGWPLVAYGTNYDGTPIYGGRSQLEGTEQPRYYWDPAIGPGGMDFYSGSLIPEWKNNLFVAALAGQHLARLVIQGDKIVGEERLLQDQHQRIRDVKTGPDGALWVITDEAEGRLIRLAPRASTTN
ncbi:PQQ-dependent sugar dehydrogenase [Sphingomonas sp. RIT328]|uniref:PQQ-dependent sugar dehydrogenase n=1 Tax=Sphingomonas sp. RIT328 TaxID=1470591 RepID=UPI00044C5602|nr:PQQ-dependent sugar dehydrogenase [Sphingomonas sp. RIT328]EZP54348.1 putative glucose/sorbosone dehydrogenase [Sphingomonas sp. RIT328]